MILDLLLVRMDKELCLSVEIYNKGADIVQTMNSDPGLAVGTYV